MEEGAVDQVATPAPEQQPPQQGIVKLTIEEVNFILAGLGELPTKMGYVYVDRLMNILRQQGFVQTQQPQG